MSEQSLRHLLRTATAPAHQRLDAAVSTELDYSPASYLVFLRGLARGIVPIEDGLTRAGIAAAVGDWDARRRTDALRDDLADFGEALPRNPGSFVVSNIAEALGALYVLEGSRLGSQLLLKQALASPSDVVRNATRHLAHGQGQRFWPGFVEILDRSTEAQSAQDSVVDGANRAFAFIHDAFTAPHVAQTETPLRMDAAIP